uniref:Uncharacterized protein n=1 Tax=Caenorhabditis japonica TaxID=281687 RepID=A0A8R1EMC6_CAEJA
MLSSIFFCTCFQQGIRAIGFSPIINTPSLLHDHNEFLNEKTFLRGNNITVLVNFSFDYIIGVQIYETLINNLANVI